MKYFTNFNNVKYEGKNSTNDFSYKYYDPNRIVNGAPLRDQLRFSVAYWHSLTYDGKDIFGDDVYDRPWYSENEMEHAFNKVDAMFEMLEILDLDYFCFHDIDIAPFGNSLEEFYHNLDLVTDKIKLKMQETGKKLLWNTVNAFSDKKFVQGAASSGEFDVVAIYASMIKKGLDLSKKLNGENFVFWGGREGYEDILNTDILFEQDNIARILHLAKDYSDEIGHPIPLLLEPKPKEPMKHQYDYDVETTLFFIKKYGLEDRVKLNIEANHATLAGHTFEHELHVARINGALGSLDANQGDSLLGWDTDEFPTDMYTSTLSMYEVIKNGGIKPGGINFDAKTRRSSSDLESLILSHIIGCDILAKAYITASSLLEDRVLENIKDEKYSSFKSDIGKKFINNELSLNQLDDYAKGLSKVSVPSSYIEKYRFIVNQYIMRDI